MRNNSFLVNTDMDIITYVKLIDELVEEYIDENGNYNPHYGELKAVSMFYNICVKKSPYDEMLPHDIDNAMDLKDIIADETFLKLYAEAISDVRPGRLSFGNAYEYAQKIVEDRKSSLSRVINSLQTVLIDLINNMNNNMDEEALALAARYREMMPNGKIDFEKLLDAYSKSKMYAQIHSDDNVIQINK